MKTTLFGRIDHPAVAAIGVWDPFLARHEQLCTTLAASAHARSLSSVAIVLHPNPPALLNGDQHFPMYDDLAARVWRLRACGIDAVLKLQMTRSDLDLGAAALLDTVQEALLLAELWLGQTQTLGRGEAGSRETVAALAAQRGVELLVLPRPPAEAASAGYQALQLLTDGRLAEAIGCVGHAPVRSRPKSGLLRLPWRPGRYRAVPLQHPGAAPIGPGVTVTLTSGAQQRPTMHWPDRRTRYLAFVAGAADEEAAATMSAAS
jgi:FAD synthase